MSLRTAPAPLVFALQVALLVATGAVMGRGRRRRALAWSLVGIGLLLPWGMEDVPSMRAVSGLLSIFGPMRTLELTLRPMPVPLPLRVAMYLLPLDVPRTRLGARHFDRRLFAHTLVHLAVFLAGVATIVLASGESVLAHVLRLFGAVLFLYGGLDAVANLTRLALGLASVETQTLQNDPILAESAGDFWGRRWNRPVGNWLRSVCFMPVARRSGARAGALATFSTSALLHFLPVLIALGPLAALSSGAYFVVEALLIVIEGPLRVPRWRRPLRHAWAAFAVLGPSPLFLIPGLQLFHAW